MNLTLSDRVVDPPEDTRTEWQFSLALAKKLSERAAARGMTQFTSRLGMPIRLDNLYEEITKNGHFADDDTVINEMVTDSAVAGTIPSDTTLETLRRDGFVRFTGWGRSPMALAQASDLKPDQTHSPFRWQTEKKEPFPTLTRRAQFYIDHPWFIEAGEALPVHKENPPMGGDYPLVLTSGHSRWSIHSMNQSDRAMLGTGRGEPVVLLSAADASARGIGDGAMVRVHNDVSSFAAQAKVSSGVRPGQVVSYNGWEPYQYADWKHAAEVEPGMVKWLHFAGGEGHLKYWTTQWQPAPIDRAFRVEVEAEVVGGRG